MGPSKSVAISPSSHWPLVWDSTFFLSSKCSCHQDFILLLFLLSVIFKAALFFSASGLLLCGWLYFHWQPFCGCNPSFKTPKVPTGSKWLGISVYTTYKWQSVSLYPLHQLFRDAKPSLEQRFPDFACFVLVSGDLASWRRGNLAPKSLFRGTSGQTQVLLWCAGVTWEWFHPVRGIGEEMLWRLGQTLWYWKWKLPQCW